MFVVLMPDFGFVIVDLEFWKSGFGFEVLECQVLVVKPTLQHP